MSENGNIRQLLATFFFDVDTKALDKGAKEVKAKSRDLMMDLRHVATAFAGGAIGIGIKNFVKDTVEEITAIRRGAAELSITTDEFQALRSAGRALGIDIKWLHFSMERLMVSTELAARGSTRQATSMKLAGLTAKDANGHHKTASELFLDLAGGLEKIQDPAKRAIIVWDLFGRGGHRLLPMLTVGRERLQQLMETTKKYGQYSKETIALAAQFTVSTETLNAAYTGLKDTLIKSMLPALERGIVRTREWITWFVELSKRSMIGRAILYSLSAVIAGMAVKMLMVHPYIMLVVGAFTALVLILDDLLVFWKGGHSLLGDIIDAIGGKGTHVEVVEALHAAWRGFIDTMKDFGGWVKDHPEWLTGLKLLVGAAGMGLKGVNFVVRPFGEAIGNTLATVDAVNAVGLGENRGGKGPAPPDPDFVGPLQSYNQARGRTERYSGGDTGKAAHPTTYVLHTNVHFHGVPIDKAVAENVQKVIRDAVAAQPRAK